LNEKWLVYQVRVKKEPEAYGKLYDLYIEKIYRFVYFKISHRQEAEDLTSEIFLKTWNYLIEERSRNVRSFSGLIYSIARNNVIDWYRKKAKTQECGLDELINTKLDDKADLEIATSIKQESNQILKLIKGLKQDYREVIFLRLVEELPIADIAQITGKNKTAVRVTLHRAVKKLQEMTKKDTK